MSKPTVQDAVKADLATMSGLERSAMALVALTFARDFDAAESVSEKVACARALRETLAELRAMVPPAPEVPKDEDAIDELLSRRAKRARSSAAKD